MEYYKGKDITVRFDVLKDGEKVNAASAIVKVYKDREFVIEDVGKVAGSEVRYILKGEYVKKVGTYVFVFDVAVRGMGNYTHVIEVDVKKLPVKESGDVK